MSITYGNCLYKLIPSCKGIGYLVTQHGCTNICFNKGTFVCIECFLYHANNVPNHTPFCDMSEYSVAEYMNSPADIPVNLPFQGPWDCYCGVKVTKEDLGPKSGIPTCWRCGRHAF